VPVSRSADHATRPTPGFRRRSAPHCDHIVFYHRHQNRSDLGAERSPGSRCWASSAGAPRSCPLRGMRAPRPSARGSRTRFAFPRPRPCPLRGMRAPRSSARGSRTRFASPRPRPCPLRGMRAPRAGACRRPTRFVSPGLRAFGRGACAPHVPVRAAAPRDSRPHGHERLGAGNALPHGVVPLLQTPTPHAGRPTWK
jgi:hypothetical protein